MTAMTEETCDCGCGTATAVAPQRDETCQCGCCGPAEAADADAPQGQPAH
jgi:hypothetical protein